MIQINIENLTKKYGNHLVFKDINMIIESNKYVFLVGENGSGKSTFIKCLLDLIKYEGEIRTHNLLFSYAPEKLALPDYITMKNYLYLVGLNKNMSRKEVEISVNYYINLFNMNKYEKEFISNLSKGSKQKIVIVQALLGNSDVYIFDEPLSGLDLESRKIFIKEITKLKQKEKIIIISTHHIDDFKYKNKVVYNFPLGNINDQINAFT